MSLIVMEGFDWLPTGRQSGGAAGADGKMVYYNEIDVYANGSRGGNYGTVNFSYYGQTVNLVGKPIPAALQHNTVIFGAWCSANLGPAGYGALDANTFTLLGLSPHFTLSVTRAGALTATGGSGTIATTADGIWPGAPYIEVKVFSHPTAGTAIVKLNGTAVINVSGVNTQFGSSDLFTNLYCLAYTGGGVYWDDIYLLNGGGAVNNDFLGDCRVVAFRPNVDGALADWVPSTGSSHYALLGGLPRSWAGEYVEAAASGATDTYGYPDATGAGVRAVQVSASAYRTDTVEAKTLGFVARSGAGVVAQAAQTHVMAIGGGYPAYWAGIFDVQPNGSVWDIASLNGAEFGIRVVS